jgi:hypothetical protein
MNTHRTLLLAAMLGAAGALLPGRAAAQAQPQAVGADAFTSSDAEGTDVLRAGMYFDFSHADDEHYRGLRVEHADYSLAGGRHARSDRLYYRFADTGTRWKWNGALGTDGDTWLGSASIHNDAPRRQEYFVERSIVETPQGLDRGIYSTFAGAAYDLPLGDRNVVTALAGVQDFTGSNQRLHLRGRYIRVLSESMGLSAQLRTRWFRSSEPHEFDYYSPRWFAEAIPTLQVRRFRGGWMYQAAAGWGRQRDSETDWRRARAFEASVTSPANGPWSFKAGVGYSDTPGDTGGYNYTHFMLEASRRF